MGDADPGFSSRFGGGDSGDLLPALPPGAALPLCPRRQGGNFIFSSGTWSAVFNIKRILGSSDLGQA